MIKIYQLPDWSQLLLLYRPLNALEEEIANQGLAVQFEF